MLLLVAARYLEEREHRPAVAALLSAIEEADAAPGVGAAPAPADGSRWPVTVRRVAVGTQGAGPVGDEVSLPRDAGDELAASLADDPDGADIADAADAAGGLADEALAVLASGERLAAPSAASAGTRVVIGRSAEGRPPLLVVAVPAADGDRWIAHREAPALDASLAAIRRTTLVAVPLAALAVAVTTWFVAGIAVWPIRALRQAAERIRPESVDRPIDVTDEDAPREIRRLEDALNDALGRVDAGYRAQERFLLNVSHELKTPISVVLTEVQVRLARPGVTAAERRVLEQVASEMRRLGDLVESFLLLARVRHGDVPRKKLPVGLDELVAESADGCTPMADQAEVGIEIELDEAAADGATIDGDLDLLRTMLDNLVHNAVRFSPSGGTVRIRASADHGTASLSVADDGPGIPPSLLPRLFDRFSQAEGERLTARGTGLGLSIAAGVAELHGGSIIAENLEHGCRLTVRLPLAGPPAGGDRCPALDRPVDDGSSDEPGPARGPDRSGPSAPPTPAAREEPE